MLLGYRITLFLTAFLLTELVEKGCTVVYQYPVYDVEAFCVKAPTVLRLSPSMPSLVMKWNSRSTFKDDQRQRNCSFVIQPPEGHGILVKLKRLQLRVDSDGHCSDKLEFNFMTDPDNTATSLKVCQTSKINQGLITSFSGENGNEFGAMSVHFIPAQKSKTSSWFELVFTQFHDRPCSKGDEVKCRSGFCISNDLACDKIDNCGDLSDEEDCKSEWSGITLLAFSLCGGLLLLVSLVLIICFVAMRRRKAAMSPYARMKDELLIS